jgi:hypothetical protein
MEGSLGHRERAVGAEAPGPLSLRDNQRIRHWAPRPGRAVFRPGAVGLQNAAATGNCKFLPATFFPNWSKSSR